MDKWAADPEQLEEAGRELIGLANDNDATLDILRSIMTLLATEWTGEAATQAMLTFWSWDKDAVGIQQRLRDAGKCLLDMGGRYHRAHTLAESLWRES